MPHVAAAAANATTATTDVFFVLPRAVRAVLTCLQQLVTSSELWVIMQRASLRHGEFLFHHHPPRVREMCPDGSPQHPGDEVCL